MPVKNIIRGQTVTKEKLQRAPSAFGTSPKWDNEIHIIFISNFHVPFGGGRVGVDFYCHKASLVIKVDGDVHDLQQEEDARREKVLSEMGLRIVRFRNEEVMKNLAGAASSLCSLLV